jgi:CHAT domain-containing protein
MEIFRDRARLELSEYHPGLLSGIVLTGANQSPADGKDDGILTALEVGEMDLSRVDLVTLSACETGLGPTAGGEGLLGLQRAFQTAGARTTVASLWRVSDKATQTLMSRFYANLWSKKMPKLEALRQAQLAILRGDANRDVELASRATRRGTALLDYTTDDRKRLPPFYWAAFILSGDWR